MTSTQITKQEAAKLAWLPANLPPEVKLMFNTLADLAIADDTTATSISIMENILSQDTEEAILGAAEAGTVSAEHYIDIPFRVKQQEVQWRKSADKFIDEGSMPYYGLARTTDVDGKPMVLNLGGVSVTPTLFGLWDKEILAKYDAEGGFPFVLGMEKTQGGWDLLKLRKHVTKAQK